MLAGMEPHWKIDERKRMTATRHCGKVLIVDPDRLTRWSVKAYLGEHLEVLSAESAAGALQVLSQQTVEAVVVSEDLPNQGADKVEIHARSGNPCVVIVRTVSEPVREGVLSESTVRLEKPFKLSRLAELLGVGNP